MNFLCSVAALVALICVPTIAWSAPPTATTSAATAVTLASATLNGLGNPGGVAATGWFRYSLTDPGTCDDTFGLRTPASGGSFLGSGASPVPYARSISGLAPGTAYFFCAIISNSEGMAFGSVLSFATESPPTATTSSATAVTFTSATLNGTGNPAGFSTSAWFRYSPTSPGTCNDTFGTRAPTSGGSNLGSGTSPVSYARPISGLASGTTYYFCAIALNSAGTAFGSVLSFATDADPPTAATSGATGVTSMSATLNGSVIPNGVATSGWFRYGTTHPGTCNDTFGTRAPASGGIFLGSGASPVSYSRSISGLAPLATYFFCAIASNSAGTAFGSVLGFTTDAAPPTSTTSAATAVTMTSVSLNGSGIPGGLSTMGWFRYSATEPGTCNDTFGLRAPTSGGSNLGSGTSPVFYTRSISGLTLGTTYYFCAITSNGAGMAFGSVLSFTTEGAPPTATTSPATAVSLASATLNGSGNPGGVPATGWFRYGATDPGTCDDTFGTRAPTSGGVSLGSGASPVSYARSITGLAPGTTYFFCAITSNSAGTAFGSILSFTTQRLPTAATLAPTAVTYTSATLNGTGNPEGFSTTGWFRYSATDPGICNDTFGTRAPTSGGSNLGSSTSPVSYARPISGLAPGTTYYFCAIASNSVGTAFGSILSLSTDADPPTAATSGATGVTSMSAILNGSGIPNAVATSGWFRYGTTDPGTCDDTFGTRAPTSGGIFLGSGASPVSYARSITGLAPGTTYFFCAITSNSAGTALGSVLSFETLPVAPAVPTATCWVHGILLGTLLSLAILALRRSPGQSSP